MITENLSPLFRNPTINNLDEEFFLNLRTKKFNLYSRLIESMIILGLDEQLDLEDPANTIVFNSRIVPFPSPEEQARRRAVELKNRKIELKSLLEDLKTGLKIDFKRFFLNRDEGLPELESLLININQNRGNPGFCRIY